MYKLVCILFMFLFYKQVDKTV
jgi:hypothetical protein